MGNTSTNALAGIDWGQTRANPSPAPAQGNALDGIDWGKATPPAPIAAQAAQSSSTGNALDGIDWGASASAPQQQPKPEPAGSVAKAWSWLNTPLVNFTREGAGPIETGIENFASGLTSPTTVGLAVATLGSGLVEDALVSAGKLSATDAAAAVLKGKLAVNGAFLAKYGYDLGHDTLPQFEMNWNDYRNATTNTDKQKALDKLEEFGTESVLNAIATGFAVKGTAADLQEIERSSAKGQALAQTGYANKLIGTPERPGFQEENTVGLEQAKQDAARLKKIVPDPARRIAITHNIEYLGDPNALEAEYQSAAADPARAKTAQKFRDAKNLSEDEIGVRDYLNNMKQADFKHLAVLNLLPEDAEKENYVPHLPLFEEVDPETGKPIEQRVAAGDTAMLKKRVYSTIAEGEKHGVRYATEDAVDLFTNYHERVSNLISKNNFAEGLAEERMNDGLAMGAPGHLFPGYTRAVDAPLTPVEVENLKKAGQFEPALRSGRIYPVAPETVRAAKMVGEPGLVVADRLPVPYDAHTIGEPLPEQRYVMKQSDFVNSGLAVWRPVTAAEAALYPPGTDIVPFGQGPFPEQAIMEPGMRGIPGAEPAAAAPRVARVRVPVFVRPEIAAHLIDTLESRTPKSPLVGEILKVSSVAKRDLLSLSPFHWATILNRTLESGLNPIRGTNRKFLFMPKDIDYYNLTPAQSAAIRDGISTGSTRPGYSFNYISEGNAGEGSFIDKIPLIGDWNKAIEEKLFGGRGWITSLKFDLYDKLKGQILSAHPEMSDVEAGRVAASQVNNKFGGLNYTVMGRKASTQHAMRGFLLAPDFLESSGRSILDVAGGHGGTLLKSLVAFNVAQWLFTRGLNYMVSGDTRPDSGLTVLSKDGKREYNMRTTLGDFLHFAQAPRDFLANRINPILGRAPAEIVSGEDEFGHKVTGAQEFFDTLRQFTPIPLQGIYPNQQVSQASPLDKALQSTGVQSRKHYSPAETAAQEFMNQRGDEGAPLEGDELAKAQLRYKLENQLRTAINAKDTEGKIIALNAIHAAESGPDAKLSPTDGEAIIKTANKFPSSLQGTVAHLGLDDALQVWDKAGLMERRALRPIIQKKIENWQLSMGKRTRNENDSMRQRIQAFRYSLGS